MADVNFYDSMLGTYTTFSGADVVATFAGEVIGSLQAITISMQREKAPLYVLGRPDPISFSRGKRGIAGSLIFLVFDREALLEVIAKKAYDGDLVGWSAQYGGTGITSDLTSDVSAPQAIDLSSDPGGVIHVYGSTLDNWNTIVRDALTINTGGFRRLIYNYNDQLPPFDINITFANEYGGTAHATIYKAEILNEGFGLSIDDIVVEKQMTYVARGYERIMPGFAASGTDKDNRPGNVPSTLIVPITNYKAVGGGINI